MGGDLKACKLFFVYGFLGAFALCVGSHTEASAQDLPASLETWETDDLLESSDFYSLGSSCQQATKEQLREVNRGNALRRGTLLGARS